MKASGKIGSSGACDYSFELPHWSYCFWFDVCWSFGVVGLEWYPCRTQTQPHRNSNTHRTKNNTTDVVIQQNCRKLLMMDMVMSETCWAHKKWNKIASDIKLVFYSSTITMMHGPINISLLTVVLKSVPLFWFNKHVFRFLSCAFLGISNFYVPSLCTWRWRTSLSAYYCTPITQFGIYTEPFRVLSKLKARFGCNILH